MFERVNARSSSVTLPRATPFERFDSIEPRPFATSSSLTSRRTTQKPAAAATCAMPCPIVPAPRTAIVLIGSPITCAFVLSSRGVLKWSSASGRSGLFPALRCGQNSTTFAGEVILHARRKRLPKESAEGDERGERFAPRVIQLTDRRPGGGLKPRHDE